MTYFSLRACLEVPPKRWGSLERTISQGMGTRQSSGQGVAGLSSQRGIWRRTFWGQRKEQCIVLLGSRMLAGGEIEAIDRLAPLM